MKSSTKFQIGDIVKINTDTFNVEGDDLDQDFLDWVDQSLAQELKIIRSGNGPETRRKMWFVKEMRNKTEASDPFFESELILVRSKKTNDWDE